MNVEEALRQGPQLVRDLENRLHDHRVETEDLVLKAKVAEGDVEAEVAAETTGDGKKAFPNEALRAAEVRRRLASDGDVGRIRDVLRDRAKVEQRMRSTLAFYEAVQRNARAIALSRSALDLDFAGET